MAPWEELGSTADAWSPEVLCLQGFSRNRGPPTQITPKKGTPKNGGWCSFWLHLLKQYPKTLTKTQKGSLKKHTQKSPSTRTHPKWVWRVSLSPGCLAGCDPASFAWMWVCPLKRPHEGYPQKKQSLARWILTDLDFHALGQSSFCESPQEARQRAPSAKTSFQS